MKRSWWWSSANADGTSPPRTPSKYILGYTVGNDVTARDLQKTDGQWTRAKGFDTFCPFGPWIDTDFDPSDAVGHLPRQRADAPDGLHAGYGLQRSRPWWRTSRP